jgi:hypothetical protein
LILFPSTYQQTIGIWERDRVVTVRGRVNAKDRDGNITSEVKIMVDDAREITPEQAAAYQERGKKVAPPKPGRKKVLLSKASMATTSSVEAPRRLFIRLEKGDDTDTLLLLKKTLDKFQGETEVVLVMGMQEEKQVIRLPIKVTTNEESLISFKELVGPHNVILQ